MRNLSVRPGDLIEVRPNESGSGQDMRYAGAELTLHITEGYVRPDVPMPGELSVSYVSWARVNIPTRRQLTAPAGTVAGDLLVAGCFIATKTGSALTGVDAPPEFDEVYAVTEWDLQVDPHKPSAFWVGVKRADEVDAASGRDYDFGAQYTHTSDQTVSCYAVVARVPAVNVIDGAAPFWDPLTSAVMSPFSFEPVGTDDVPHVGWHLVVAGAGWNGIIGTQYAQIELTSPSTVTMFDPTGEAEVAIGAHPVDGTQVSATESGNNDLKSLCVLPMKRV